MVDVECPLDGCEYTGSVKSVEAHISGNSRGEHQGKVGRQFRDRLVDGSSQPVELEPEEKADPPEALGEQGGEASETPQQTGSVGSERANEGGSASKVTLVAGTALVGLAVLLEANQEGDATSEGEAQATSEASDGESSQATQTGPQPVLGGA